MISVHKLDIICLSETYLNPESSPDDENLETPGYNIFRKDHSSNTKRGEVCVYYKNTLSFQIINIKDLQECITFQIRIGRKCCKFICIYRSPSQTNDEFESFLKNFELTLDKIHEDNPFMIFVLGDFNFFKSATSCLLAAPSYASISHNFCFIKLLTLTLITFFLITLTFDYNSFSSCIDQVVFVKIDLPILYLPHYEITVWFYEKANPELIRRAISEFYWTRALSNVSIDKKFAISPKRYLI